MRIFLNMLGSLMLGAALLLFPLSNVYAKAGCCSSHGGVAGCDSSSGRLKCKDNTLSKTCNCAGTTTSYTKTKAVKTPAATEVQKTTVTKTSAVIKPTKGCCSKHGGVGSCNTKTGFYTCKDGTQSATCKCQ